MLQRQRAAVVRIMAIKLITVEGGHGANSEEDEAVAELLRSRPIPHLPGEPPRAAVRHLGCGILIRRDGYIITNAHLVSDAAWLAVRLSESREFAARLVGIDVPTDIAVLKIEAADLPVVTLGDAANLQPGDWIAAIGAPFGFEGSITAGVVSAVDRVLPDDETYQPFIQTDLPLNPGNSGGPLLDARGEVVGINSQILVRGEGNSGIAFAIPIGLALRIEDQLIRRGYFERGDIGIEFQDVGATLSRAFGLAAPTGALVNAIEVDGPAARAQLRPGDIITELNGQRIGRASQLASAISLLQPGDTAQVAIWRNQKPEKVSVHITQAQPPPLRIQRTAATPPDQLVSVRQLSTKERHALGTDGYIVVTSVSALAAAAGIEAGDILLTAGATPLRTPQELQRALAAGLDALALLIERDGRPSFVALPLDQPAPAHAANAAAER
jgi:serine protease Do